MTKAISEGYEYQIEYQKCDKKIKNGMLKELENDREVTL